MKIFPNNSDINYLIKLGSVETIIASNILRLNIEQTTIKIC